MPGVGISGVVPPLLELSEAVELLDELLLELVVVLSGAVELLLELSVELSGAVELLELVVVLSLFVLTCVLLSVSAVLCGLLSVLLSVLLFEPTVLLLLVVLAEVCAEVVLLLELDFSPPQATRATKQQTTHISANRVLVIFLILSPLFFCV